ncbi:MAG TPA: YihY/virulence factor BrkB family protein [Cytophaga sp.]|jgi:membrane protein|nr:YihY/virulence factor BrkB family protein [Cytophaga sp.]
MLKKSFSLLKSTFQDWNKRDPFRQSAVIAYYAIFSMPGLLVLIITIMGYFFNKDTVSQRILTEIANTLGADTSAEIKSMLASAGKTKATILGSIIGIATLLVGATGVFIALQKTLNVIWEVQVTAQTGIWPVVKSRLFSFGLILAIAFLLLISFVVSTATAAIGEWIRIDTSDFLVTVFNVFNFIISFVIITILFALMFKILPDAKIKWKYIWPGAFLTSFLFTIGKTALSFYFGKATPESVYGAGGSVILILLWVTYSSMILFFGAEFTHTYAVTYGEKPKPTEIADSVKEGERKHSKAISK